MAPDQVATTLVLAVVGVRPGEVSDRPQVRRQPRELDCGCLVEVEQAVMLDSLAGGAS